MSNSLLFFIFVFLFSYATSSFSSINTTHSCSVQQSKALLLFKQNISSINDTYYDYLCKDQLASVMMNWKKNTDCCDWNGVICDYSTGDVTGLDLSCGMLQGTIHPNTTLFHLPRLERLNLAYNNFTDSQLPPGIGRLSSSLTHLNISVCRFTGQVPADISHLHKLVSLDLSVNYFDFTLKPHVFISLLQNLTFMEELSLEFANISSILPSNLNISSSLRFLNLGYTGLQGNLPHNIYSLQSLEKLDLSTNNFIGQIPSEILLLPKLVSLDLSWNGNEKEDLLIQPHILSMLLQNSTILSDLCLTYVNIGAVLPTYLNIFAPLRFLDLDSTNLQGKLPSSLFTLSSLETIRLGNNELTGQIDVLDDGRVLQTFQKLTNLIELDLSNNRFRGAWELDTLLSSLANLETLILSHSGVSVTTSNANIYVNSTLRILSLAFFNLKVFPLCLKGMILLQQVDLSNNDIQGHIPHWVGEIGRDALVVFDISNNLITGTIPNIYVSWGRLQGFILKGNNLEGKVPTFLHKCQNLKIIDLGNNHLNDIFPDWIGDLPKLMVLVLRSNNFHGSIVPSLTVKFPFPSLRVLDLSYNGFVGPLPTKHFQNFNAMKNVVKSNTRPKYVSMDGMYYYSIKVSVKGTDREFPQLLVDFTIVDLSNNKFEKEIPHVIGNLKALKALKLSNNSLTGQIPQAFRNLSEIESLDLSLNQLSGEIPQSLTELTFLEFLNLSQNLLVGRIPYGNQFDTFDANSFMGNPKLCGVQLSKNCGDQHLQEPLEGDGDFDDEEGGITWEVVMIGYGCGTLLGFTMGYLMLSTENSNWFNSIADAVERMIFKSQDKRRYIYIYICKCL